MVTYWYLGAEVKMPDWVTPPVGCVAGIPPHSRFKWDGHLFSSGGIAHTRTTLSWDPFASWNGHVYATNGLADSGSASTEILSVTVPSVCR
jgi:hypothetical protein